MKKCIAVLLGVLIFMSGCTIRTGSGEHQKYTYEFMGTFDTVIQFVGYAENKDQFMAYVKQGQKRFEELNKQYDQYHDYDRLNNVKIINDQAGIKSVAVGKELIDIILFCKEWNHRIGNEMNIALGPVLSIWHNYREEGIKNPQKARIPAMGVLKHASTKTDFSQVEVDEGKQTVFLREAGMSLDLGAVAKGYATEIVANELEQAGFKSFAISSGGNVRTVGTPKDGERNKWGVGIENPDGDSMSDNSLIDTVYMSDTSMVTSGDYQRYYEVGGERYHHIIDPQTLMPAKYYRAVTIMTRDSGVADFLSTTAFILPYDQSRALIEKLEGVGALWVMPDGTVNATDNFLRLMKNRGGAKNN